MIYLYYTIFSTKYQRIIEILTICFKLGQKRSTQDSEPTRLFSARYDLNASGGSISQSPPVVNTLGEFFAADARCDKKKGTPQRSSSSMVPSLLNDMPFVNSIPQPLWVVNTLGEISCCPCKNKPPSNGRVVQRTLPFHISMAYTDSIADFLSDVKGGGGTLF